MSIAAAEAIRRQAWLLAAFVIALDQFTKYFVRTMVVPNELLKDVITPFFNVVNYRNHGVGFGLMADGLMGNRLALIFMSLVITVVVIWWLLHVYRLRPALAYGSIIGGALSNVVDRIVDGSVFDFLEFHMADHYWPAFNLADCAVVIGVAVLLLDGVMNKEKPTGPSPLDED